MPQQRTVTDWWQTFFDADDLRLWEASEAPGKTDGRIARALAERGAQVLGVDFSPDLLAEAERRRGGLPSTRLRYERHDLRLPLQESGVDAAVNLFSSLGYGSEADDVAMLSTLRAAVRPGGLVFEETTHRDGVAAGLSRTQRFGSRLPDGSLVVEEPRLDPVTGRVVPFRDSGLLDSGATWYLGGPRMSPGCGRGTIGGQP